MSDSAAHPRGGVTAPHIEQLVEELHCFANAENIVELKWWIFNGELEALHQVGLRLVDPEASWFHPIGVLKEVRGEIGDGARELPRAELSAIAHAYLGSPGNPDDPLQQRLDRVAEDFDLDARAVQQLTLEATARIAMWMVRRFRSDRTAEPHESRPR